MFLDMHVHSKYSKDAVLSPQHITELAKQRGIVAALTDHNNAKGWQDYSRACKAAKIDCILGQEQKVFSQGRFAGELLFYFLNEEIKSHELLEAIDEARSQDAFISVAHPFESNRRIHFGKFLGLEKIVQKIDAIEAYNSRCLLNFPNKKAMEFAIENKTGITAGSDAHFPVELGNAVVEVNADSLEEARKLLAKGKAKVHGKISSPVFHLLTQLAKRGLIKKESD